MKNKKKGFTLIELLVVIAIIGILSAIGLVALNGAREKARDAQRRSDIGQVRTALVLYSDDEGLYPNTVAGAGTEDLSPCVATAGTVGGVLTDGGALITDYLSQELVSPKCGNAIIADAHTYQYDASGDGLHYMLWTTLEAGTGTYLYVVNELGEVWDYADNYTTEPTCLVGSCTPPAA